MLLAASYDAVELKRRGFTVRWMTWQATSARPYYKNAAAGRRRRRRCPSSDIGGAVLRHLEVQPRDVRGAQRAGAYTRPLFSST